MLRRKKSTPDRHFDSVLVFFFCPRVVGRRNGQQNPSFFFGYDQREKGGGASSSGAVFRLGTIHTHNSKRKKKKRARKKAAPATTAVMRIIFRDFEGSCLKHFVCARRKNSKPHWFANDRKRTKCCPHRLFFLTHSAAILLFSHIKKKKRRGLKIVFNSL